MKIQRKRSSHRTRLSAIAAAVGLTVGADVAAFGEYGVRVVPIPANDVVYVPPLDLLYASVPSAAGLPYGNTLVQVDPVGAQIVDAVFIGSEPGKLALSDDGQFIYAGLTGAAAVRRFNVLTNTAGLQFSLGSDSFSGPWYPEDIEVLPGSPNSVAISLRNMFFSPRHEGVAIYDNGVRRPVMTGDHTGSNVITFGDNAIDLYGYNNETTEYGLRTMSVSPNGVAVVRVEQNVINGFYLDILHDSGRIYATSGQVVDAASMALLGTYSAYGPVAVDTLQDRVYFVQDGAPSRLRIFDRLTFVPIQSVPLPECQGTPRKLITVDASRLALICTGPGLLLIDGDGLLIDGFE